MDKTIIGREAEKVMLAELEKAVATDMLAVTGRRRVGKTWLIKTFFESRMHFEFSGVLNASNPDQLKSFSKALAARTGKKNMAVPHNWLDAFSLLASWLEKAGPRRKLIVFIDELPWLDNHKSGFLAGLEWFWNSWAYGRNILLIVCGSAASWMRSKIINNRGGLHNRVTKRMHLQPFTLTETEAYLKQKGVVLSRYDILHCYMALGGIPHYLKEIRKGESAAQNINRICFEKNGLLVNEFENLYHALFTDARQHISIIQALASKQKGLSRGEILAISKLKDGGTFTKLLEELEQSDFISVNYPYGKVKKEALYRLVDEFSLFYLKFIYKKKNVNWQQLSVTPAYKIWSGYAFENICFKHINKIKAALGIAAVYTEQSSFYYKGSTNEPGTQIDLLIDRNDNVINICEAKFYDKAFSLDKKYAADLRETMRIFKERSKTRKSLFLTFITSFGLVQNINSVGFVQQEVTMESLF